ncbi:efflux RND transporter permease subunit [Candidatus Dependentiae bacterium]|nr:efflux RND transporter permease subunit [Candidatus Dependentiae bacterium]
MKIVKFAVDRPVATIMILLFCLLTGLICVTKLSVSLTPNIDIPSIVVLTPYPNASPIDVLNKVSKPLEEVLNTVSGVETLRSTSEKNKSVITIEFGWNTDIDLAALEIREKINTVNLPEETEKPMLHRISSSAQPIFRFDLYGDTDINIIKEFADKSLKPLIEQIEGVGKVEIKGGFEECVKVICDPNRMMAMKITVPEVIEKINLWQKKIQIGKIQIGNHSNSVIMTGQFIKIEDIKNLNLKNNIKISSVADVVLTYKEIDNISRVNGISSVGMVIKKTNEGNTLDIVKKIKPVIYDFGKKHNYLKINISKDDSVYINASQEVVSGNIQGGIILVVIILFIFLRSLKSTIIISLTIPIALISTFALLYFSNVTRNILSLAGLALGVGMMLDSSVVILENIYRHLKEGRTSKEAAVSGSEEVAISVISSNLTSIAVFFPILFLTGIASKLFTDLALSVIYSLIFSLFVALLLVPMLSAYMFKKEQETKPAYLFKLIDDFFVNIGDIFISVYIFLLKHSIGVKFESKLILNFIYKTIIVILVVGVCVLSVLKMPDRIFLPDGNIKEFKITLELEPDYNITETDIITKKIEADIKQTNTQIIATTVNPANSEIYVKLKDNVSVKDISDYLIFLEKYSDSFKYGKLFVSKVSKINVDNKKIEFSVGSDEHDYLIKSSGEIKKYLEKKEGIILTRLRGTDMTNEISAVINRRTVSENGLSAKYVSDYVFSVLNGTKSGTFYKNDKKIDIIVEGKKNKKFDKNLFLKYPILTNSGSIKRLGEFVYINENEQFNELNRTNLNNVITLESILNSKTASGKVLADIDKNVLPKYKDMTFYWYGSAKNTKESFSQLGLALIFSVFLVYIIMASQFESFIQPVIIMFSVPLVLIGVVFGLRIMNLQLDISALIGIIMLSGTVVNNGIILIDYLNILRFRGVARSDAIIEVGKLRMRPIAITTLTTILGMIPLAISQGEGSELYQGCAVVVIFGLISSTILTLFIVPIIYSLLDDFIDIFNLAVFKIQLWWELKFSKNHKIDIE